ncbi:MAG TPA: nitrous oxide-stimulated promoter family protein, partial [Bacteroidales bacterium]
MTIASEKHTVELMIKLYCHSAHKSKKLCPECLQLLSYANERLEKCIYGDKKTSCKKCLTHCYKKDMRDQIKKVMRYSGPRMLWYYPFLHFWKS